MTTDIRKVIITGGRETGGLRSYAETLAQGFSELGIPAEVIPPSQIFRRIGDLRNRSILKILSTTAVFAAPLSRRAICMAHGFPRADAQGWATVTALALSFKMAACNRNSRLVAISHYAASHLKAMYGIKVDNVIHNPLNSIFFAPIEKAYERRLLTYVGRLHPVKNLDKLLPAMQVLLDDLPDFRIRVVGDGPLRDGLTRRFSDDPRIEFAGNLDAQAVRETLRETAVFISGCETEALGIAYLEALSQGCAVVMPACGGGVEVEPDLIGTKIQTFPLSFDERSIQIAIRKALSPTELNVHLSSYTGKAVATKYVDTAAAMQ